MIRAQELFSKQKCIYFFPLYFFGLWLTIMYTAHHTKYHCNIISVKDTKSKLQWLFERHLDMKNVDWKCSTGGCGHQWNRSSAVWKLGGLSLGCSSLHVKYPWVRYWPHPCDRGSLRGEVLVWMRHVVQVAKNQFSYLFSLEYLWRCVQNQDIKNANLILWEHWSWQTEPVFYVNKIC